MLCVLLPLVTRLCFFWCSFDRSSELFLTVGDEYQALLCSFAKARVMLDHIFGACILLRIPLDAMVNLSPQRKIFLPEVEKLVTSCMTFAAKTSNLMLCLGCYLSMAEIRLLQGRQASAKAFWLECRDQLFTYFMDGTSIFLSRGAPPSFVHKVYDLLRRLSRCLMAFDRSFINSSLLVLDASFLAEIESDQVSFPLCFPLPTPLKKTSQRKTNTKEVSRVVVSEAYVGDEVARAMRSTL